MEVLSRIQPPKPARSALAKLPATGSPSKDRSGGGTAGGRHAGSIASMSITTIRRIPDLSTNEKPGAPLGAPGHRITTLAGGDYFSISATTPAPTVRPPSRMVKRWPTSIAIGAISLMPSDTLSPGITISVPSGSSTVPVTSVVRK